MTLYNKDCYEVMASMSDHSVDLIYADPPYEYDHFKSGTGGSVNKIMKLDKTLTPINEITDTKYDLLRFCNEAMRIMKEPNIYIWCNKAQFTEYFKFFVIDNECKFEILFWNKTNALPTYSNKYLTDKEYCLYFHKGSGKTFPECYNDAKTILYQSPINRENKIYNHPNIKPLEFVKAHIRNSSREGWIVFDPFMGTGTAGVACKEIGGREYIGCEINPKHFETANSRINGAVTNTNSEKVGLFD